MFLGRVGGLACHQNGSHVIGPRWAEKHVILKLAEMFVYFIYFMLSILRISAYINF